MNETRMVFGAGKGDPSPEPNISFSFCPSETHTNECTASSDSSTTSKLTKIESWENMEKTPDDVNLETEYVETGKVSEITGSLPQGSDVTKENDSSTEAEEYRKSTSTSSAKLSNIIGDSNSLQLPSLMPKQARFGQIPSPDGNDKEGVYRWSRPTPPPARLTMVSVVSRSTIAASRQRSWIEPFVPGMKGGIGWSEAHNNRPPLKIDMDGPTACTYNTVIKPLSETNAPSWTFGTKCGVDKRGGGRTSWEKKWFQSPHVWLNKTDFVHDTVWPSPVHYRDCPTLGQRQATIHTSPAYSVPRSKQQLVLTKPDVACEPSPCQYNPHIAEKLVTRTRPAFTAGRRQGGTILWPSIERTPGPGSYNPDMKAYLNRTPTFYISDVKPNRSYTLGPFATF